MKHRSLRKGSLAEVILAVLAQMGVATRRMLGAVTYYYDEGTGETLQYSNNSNPLSKALIRAKERGLVQTIEVDGKAYLCLTKEGMEYVAEKDIAPICCEDVVAKLPPKERKKVAWSFFLLSAMVMLRSSRAWFAIAPCLPPTNVC